MFVDNANSLFIASFRGTNSNSELLTEGLHLKDVKYDLYSLNDARVTQFFYSAYKDYMRSDFLENFQDYTEQFSGYTIVITGHSLGAAMATHAALDVVLGGYADGDDILHYNYGSPRVGNYNFAQEVQKYVPTIFRIVHDKDPVPHIPGCKTALFHSKCQEDATYSGQNDLIWPAWHIQPQIFYNADSSSYKTCTAE
mmetsp:Transcript_26371/g.23289  ORF Transcript_26371/g.23289 Transcript_26371/m.23289 type:complete len:197 (-) Transcript_26371:309-899(-)